MPPKFNASDPTTAAQIEKFKSIGLTDAKSFQTAQSAKQTAILSTFIDRADLRVKRDQGELEDKKLALVLSLCVASASSSKLEEEGRIYALEAILDERLKTNEQIAGALFSLLLGDLAVLV